MAKSKSGVNRHDISKKGITKRRRTCFPKGVKHDHQQNNASKDTTLHPSTTNSESKSPTKKIVRYEKNFFRDLAVKTHANELSIPGADGVDGDAMLLRPLHGEEDELIEPKNKRKTGTGEYNTTTGNLIVEKSKLMDGINNFISMHTSVKCEKGLDMDMIDIRPWGFFSSVLFACKNCQLKSKKHQKLFEEVPTNKCGRKAAAGNVRFALLNEDVAIGPTEVQLLFAALEIQVNVSNLQKMAVKVADITENVARKDMSKWLDHACNILKARGVSSPNQISAQFDVLYHSMFRSNSHCPGQAASAATALCVESVTPQKKIIEFEHTCRVCVKGARLRGEKIPALCGHKNSKEHHNCTATIPQGQIIREYDMAWNVAQRLADKGRAVTHLTTDSDAKGRDGFIDVNKVNPSLPSLTWYKDPSHNSRNMRKKVSTVSVAGNLFGTRRDGIKWTYDEKLVCRKALALDIPKRVSLTLSNMRLYWRGNATKMIENVEKIVDYMIKCYNGDHRHCSSSPLARLTGCSGFEKGKCWFNRSHVLKAAGVFRLELSSKNKKMMREVISMKLSKEGLGFMARGETSSKCESSNRAINKSYAKNRKFWRVGAGRVSSAILRVNNGFLKSTRMKFKEMNVSLPNDGAGDTVIKQYQKKRVLIRRHQTSKKAVQRKHERIAEKASRYFMECTKDTNQGDYAKYQLDDAKTANNMAIEKLSDSNASNDESTQKLEQDLRRALSIAEHMGQTLHAAADQVNKCHDYAKTPSTVAKKRNIRQKRKLAQQSRISRQETKRAFRKTKTRAAKAFAERNKDFACFE